MIACCLSGSAWLLAWAQQVLHLAQHSLLQPMLLGVVGSHPPAWTLAPAAGLAPTGLAPTQAGWLAAQDWA